MKSRIAVAATVPLILGLLAACGGGGSGTSTSSANDAQGPITIWYSNNAQEVTWGKQVVAAWNKSHPDEKVTGQQIPAGKTDIDRLADVDTRAQIVGNDVYLVGFQGKVAMMALDSGQIW